MMNKQQYVKKGWARWNVSLWIANDEGLYQGGRLAIRQTHSLKAAAELFLTWLHETGQYSTLDGTPYSKTNLLHALRNIR